MSDKVILLTMYFSMAIASFSVFLLIATFRGKNVTDWLLLFRDLLLSLMAAWLFVDTITDLEAPRGLRVLHWTLSSIVSVALFASLVDRNVIGRIPKLFRKFRNKD